MNYKTPDGYTIFEGDYYKTPFISKRVKVLTEMFLKFILGLAFGLLISAWWNAFQPPTFTQEEMRDYAVLYLNLNK